MSARLKRRTYQRFGVVVGMLGLLVLGTMAGVLGDEEPSVMGVVIGIVMVLLGGWSIWRGQRVGTSRE